MLGFGFVILGAICGGSFGLPSKFARKDTPWEVLWGLFFFIATILIPATLGPLAVDGLYETCKTGGWEVVIGPLAFGLLWGLGSMTLGLSFAFIGLSLAYAINYGAQIAFGSILPMLIHHPEKIATEQGYVILAGVAVCLLGVVVCGKAGILKDRSLKLNSTVAESEAQTKKPKIYIGLLVAFISGILCACYAVAYSFGDQVKQISQDTYGNEVWRSAFAVTALILWGGAVSSCLYCVYKLTINKTWNKLVAPGIGLTVLLAFIMACLHNGAILCFGVGAENLGALGVSVGYAAFMSIAIIMGNINGFLTHEWKGASRNSVNWIVAGIVVLIIGVCILGKAKSM